MINRNKQRLVKISSMTIETKDENGETVIKDITNTHNVSSEPKNRYITSVTETELPKNKTKKQANK